MFFNKSSGNERVVRRVGVPIFCILNSVFLASMLTLSAAVSSNTLTLEQLQWLALTHDPFMQGSEFRERAYLHESNSVDSWENPRLSGAIQNLPTNGFSLQQEPMSQIKVGLQQALPRGNSAKLERDVLVLQADKEKITRDARKRWVIQQLSHDWLTWYKAEQTALLLAQELLLFEQLLAVTESIYRSGAGDTKQQDIIQIRLERMRLQDRLLTERQHAASALATLSRWVTVPSEMQLHVPEQLLIPNAQKVIEKIGNKDSLSLVASHPSVKLLSFDELVETRKLALAREQKKPKWAFEASYAYREDTQYGVSQADFISVGVQVDFPLFGTKRQDEHVSATASRVSAAATDKRLEMRRLAALLDAQKVTLSSLKTRQNLYDETYLQLASDMADATMHAYTHDDGDFSEVVRARINIMDTQLEALNVELSLALAMVDLVYLVAPTLTLDVTPPHLDMTLGATEK